jgi:hypothetical protein
MMALSDTSKKKSAGLFGTLAAMLRDLRRDLSASYRPERHYMRGPGPKWRERQTQVSWSAIASR